MARNDIFIQFRTNALQASKEIDNLDEVLQQLERRGRQAAPAFRGSTTTAIGNVVNALDASIPGKPANLDVSGAQARSLTELVAAVDKIANDAVLSRIKSIKETDFTDLRTRIGAMDSEMFSGLLGLKGDLEEVLTGKYADSTKEKAAKYIKLINQEVKTLESIEQEKTELLDKLSQTRLLSSLEGIRNRFQSLGLNVQNVGDIGGITGGLATIDAGLAQAIVDFNASIDQLTVREQALAIKDLTSLGATQLAEQRKGFDRQITQAFTTRTGSIIDSFAELYTQKFGGTTAVDKSSLAQSVAFTTLFERLQKSVVSDLLSPLRQGNIPEIAQLQTTKAVGTPQEVVSALTIAEKAVNDRLQVARSQLDKLATYAEVADDDRLRTLVSQLRLKLQQNEKALEEAVARQEAAVSKIGLSSIKALGDRLESQVKIAAGSKIVNFRPDFQVDFVNQLDNLVFSYIDQVNEQFKRTNFASKGSKNFGQIAGPNADIVQNVLTRSGFFDATTATERLNTLDKATTMFENDIRGFGLSEADFNKAVGIFYNVARSLQKQYAQYESIVSGANARESQTRRTQANLLTQQGNFEQAQQLLLDLGNLTTDRVSQPGRMLTRDDLRPLTAAELTPAARADYDQNLAQNQRLTEIVQAKTPSALQRFARFGNTLLSAFNFVGATVGEAARQMSLFVDQANRLDKAAATVNALSGSMVGFGSALNLASKQQLLFGGTLEENLQGLTSLIPITKRYNVDLETLDNIARRLAIIDPLQGFSGASIALKEFFSGDITSLSRRFEIDRKTLNSIKSAGDQVAQLEELDRVLNDLGISNELLTARTQTAANTYDQLGASVSSLTALSGKILQGAFAPIAERIVDDTSPLLRGLNNIIENEQQVITLTGQIGKAFADVGKSGGEAATAIAELNSLLESLNDLRASQGQTRLSLFSPEDKETVDRLYDLSKRSGVPLVDLLSTLDPTGTPRTLGQQQADVQNRYGFFGELADSLLRKITFGIYESAASREQANIFNTGSGTNLFPTAFRGTTAELSTMFSNFSRTPANTGAAGAIREALLNTPLDLIMALENSAAQVNQLTDAGFSRQVAELLAQENINYNEAKQRAVAAILSGNLTQDQINQLLYEQLQLDNKLLGIKQQRAIIESDAITQARADIGDFGSTDLTNSLVSSLNAIVQSQAEAAQSVAASLYAAAGGGATRDFGNARSEQIVKNAERTLGINREQLYYLGQIQQREALIALERGKSVSAITALTSRFSGLNMALKDAVQLSIGFNEGIQGLVSSFAGNLSIPDQLRFYRSQQTTPGSLNTQDAVFANLSNILNVVQQQEQERIDSANKTADNLKKIEEDYARDRNKIVEDAEEERTKLLEDYEEKKLALLQDSEVSKRESKVSFYDMLFGADNLSQSTLKQYSARYEGFFAEASNLRNAGEFEKANAVLEAGVSLLTREIRYQDELVGTKERIKESDKEIAELRKEYSEAETAEERRSIQKKIDAALFEKQKAVERVRELEGLLKLSKDVDEERLKQARELKDKEKEILDKSLADRKEAEDQALAEAEQKYKDALKSREESMKQSTKAQILSFNDLMMLQTAGYSVIEAARIAAEGGSKQEIDNALKRFSQSSDYFKNLGTPAGTEIFKALEQMRQLTPSLVQSATAATQSITGLTDYLNISGYNIQDFKPADITALRKSELESRQDNTTKVQLNTSELTKNTIAINELNRRLNYYTPVTSPGN